MTNETKSLVSWSENSKVKNLGSMTKKRQTKLPSKPDQLLDAGFNRFSMVDKLFSTGCL